MSEEHFPPANDNGLLAAVVIDFVDILPATEKELGILQCHFAAILERMVAETANDNRQQQSTGLKK